MNKKTVLGKNFIIIENGKTFTVIDVESFPANKISERYKKILGYIPAKLVAINYRGILIPNLITEVTGVFRLKRVLVNNIEFKTPKAISKALGIETDFFPYNITEIK